MQWIEQIKQTKQIDEYSTVDKITVKEIDQHKTPCLNQTFNKHNKQITMINLYTDEPDFNILACVECLEENPRIYISLKEANSGGTYLWDNRKIQSLNIILEEQTPLKWL